MPIASPASILAAAQRDAGRQKLELAMLQQLRGARLDDGMVREFVFAPGRKYRADFAWPADRLLLEVDGGTWSGGAHGSGSGIKRDAEKLAAAVMAGYRLIRVVENHVRSGTGLQWVAACRGRVL